MEDTGKGIGEHKLKTIFENKFGHQRTAAVNADGNGFGLYACKKIVNSYDGEIEVLSDGRNKGASIMFTMKFEEKKAELSNDILNPCNDSMIS